MNTFELLALLRERYDCASVINMGAMEFEGTIADVLGSEPHQIDVYHFEKYESRVCKMDNYSFIFLANKGFIFAIIAHGKFDSIGVIRGLLP